VCASYSPHIHQEHSSELIKVTFAWLLFCVFIQLGTNLHNDYADFVKGADDENRVGHARATQKGWLTPQQTASGSNFCLMIAAAIGAKLAQLNSSEGGIDWDWTIVFIILTSVFNAVAYTGGPHPLGYVDLSNLSIGYSGLGDLFVFLYFGLVATMMVPYIYVRDVLGEAVSPRDLLGGGNERNEVPVLLRTAFFMALPVGWLATAIIVVNNLRDRHTDVKAKKLIIAVRFGATFSQVEYGLLVFGSYMSLPLCLDASSLYSWLPFLSLPLALPQLRAVALGKKDGADLNMYVGGIARLQLVFCILLCAALRMSSPS